MSHDIISENVKESKKKKQHAVDHEEVLAWKPSEFKPVKTLFSNSYYYQFVLLGR
jgi:hypothetical protein